MGIGLCLLLLASVAGSAQGQFVELPDTQMQRLPPVWMEAPSQTLPALSAGAVNIPAWISQSPQVAAVAFQDQGSPQPVVQSVPEVPAPTQGPPMIPPVQSPRRYFPTNTMSPRSGHISTRDAAPVPFPPDPEELDSCNLDNQHRQAMIDLMGGRNELVLSSGTVSPVGDNTLDNHLLTGWGIQGAVRHIWCSGTDTWVGFTEGGGSFWENGGNRSYVTTSGALTDTTTGNVDTISLDNFYQTTLRDLKRTTVHAALGAYFTPRRWQMPGVRAVQFNGRMGLHWGHARATYQQVPTGDLQAAIASRIAEGSLPTALTFRSNAAVTDTYIGLFTSGGVSYNRYNVGWGCFEFAEVAVGLDLQYQHDFINLRSYNLGSRGLSTLAPMATLRLLY